MYTRSEMPRQTGSHFLQIPGPTNVPERILRAMARPTIDHRSAEFGRLGLEVLEGLKEVFKTSGSIVIFPPPEPGPGRRRWSTHSLLATRC